jgi:hypothetical protein
MPALKVMIGVIDMVAIPATGCKYDGSEGIPEMRWVKGVGIDFALAMMLVLHSA